MEKVDLGGDDAVIGYIERGVAREAGRARRGESY